MFKFIKPPAIPVNGDVIPTAGAPMPTTPATALMSTPIVVDVIDVAVPLAVFIMLPLFISMSPPMADICAFLVANIPTSAAACKLILPPEPKGGIPILLSLEPL